MDLISNLLCFLMLPNFCCLSFKKKKTKRKNKHNFIEALSSLGYKDTEIQNNNQTQYTLANC